MKYIYKLQYTQLHRGTIRVGSQQGKLQYCRQVFCIHITTVSLPSNMPDGTIPLLYLQSKTLSTRYPPKRFILMYTSIMMTGKLYNLQCGHLQKWGQGGSGPFAFEITMVICHLFSYVDLIMYGIVMQYSSMIFTF